MIEIFNKVEAILKEHYKDCSEEFGKGASVTLGLFETGIMKNPQYNLALHNKTLKDELKEKDKTIRNLNHKLQLIAKQAKDELLVDVTPHDKFCEYKVETPLGQFSMVTNMLTDTFRLCATVFAYKYEYHSADECKSKILQYINSFSAKGFRAYKSRDIARKEGAIMGN